MSTALSTGRTGGEPGVSESAATKRRTERERERRHKAASLENLKKQQKRPPTGRLFSYPSSALGAGSGLKRREKLQIPLKPTRI